MKRILVISVILSLLLQSTSQFWIVSEFYINRDFIAKNLCVNRNMAYSPCHGACQLKKKLKEDKQQQEDSNVNQKEVVLFFNQNLVFNFSHSEALFPIFCQYPKTTNEIIVSEYEHSIFHPPAAVI